MLRIALLAGALVIAGSAFADEVIIHRDDALPPPPASTSTTVEHHSSGDGCSSSSVHKENDMGDSKTVTKSDC